MTGMALFVCSALFVAACVGGTPTSSVSTSPGGSIAGTSASSPMAAATPTTQPSPTGLTVMPGGGQAVFPETSTTRVASAPLVAATAGTTATHASTRYHVPVLMYHRIAPASERGNDLADLVLDPRVFDAQLAAMEAHGWRTITSGQLARAVIANDKLPARTFVITLDDGREDGYIHAFPILQKHGFVATFFVITGRVNERRYLTWTELDEMQAAGMEIGNHTANHFDEQRFSRFQTYRQVMGAQDAIKRNLGVTAVSFAYPSGRAPANLVASVKAARLEVAYTTVGGADETAATACFWPRVRVHPTTTASGILWLVDRYGRVARTRRAGPRWAGSADAIRPSRSFVRLD
jgi:peptidoglycan/xylan/chitin deacetylase (PgdA/CDA1 family)